MRICGCCNDATAAVNEICIAGVVVLNFCIILCDVKWCAFLSCGEIVFMWCLLFVSISCFAYESEKQLCSLCT